MNENPLHNNNQIPQTPHSFSPDPAENGPAVQPSNPATIYSPSSQPLATQPMVGHLDSKSGAVEIVLQWLSYGLWEWTIITLSILLSTTLNFYFVSGTRSDDHTWLAYVVASMLVLLPFAFFADRIYSKKEPEHKHGFAAVVMVINAVIVFLATIGGLIAFVLSILNLVMSSSSSDKSYVGIISSLVVAVLGLLLFVRILDFAKFKRFNRLFPLLIVLIAGTTAVLALVGPFKGEATAKEDRLIENNITLLNEAIQIYASKEGKLPTGLDALDLSGTYDKDAQLLVSKGLITYRVINSGKPNTPINTPASSSNNVNYYSSFDNKATYELCATYKKERKVGGSYYGSAGDTYIDTNNHKAGKQCYTQKADLTKLY
jgi:hypothetical protein